EVVPQLLHRVLDARAVAVLDLRPAGDARPDGVTLHVEGDLARELLDEERTFGPRADEAHVALEDVPELGQFVEPRHPDEAADPRHAFVFVARPDGPARLLGVGPHRSKLVERERPAVLADALLRVQRRP